MASYSLAKVQSSVRAIDPEAMRRAALQSAFSTSLSCGGLLLPREQVI
jgi:hypothetical protein